MSAKDTGGPAFPTGTQVEQNGATGETTIHQYLSDGMSLREYAAIKFGAALLAGGMIYGNDDHWLDDAFAKADAFIARREK